MLFRAELRCTWPFVFLPQQAQLFKSSFTHLYGKQAKQDIYPGREEDQDFAFYLCRLRI